MQYITNITFWLTSAMESLVVAICVAVLILLVSLFGFGFGVGRIWNKKWSLNAPCLLVSLPIALLTATLGATYVGMNFIDKTILSKEANPRVLQEIETVLSGSTSLMQLAFHSGIKEMTSKNSSINSALYDESSTELNIPGDTPEERLGNEQAFLSGAINAIAKGKKAGKSARTAVQGLADMPPFSYGYTPASRDDNNGSIQAAYTEAMSAAGQLGTPITLDNDLWFRNLVNPMVKNNMERFSKSVGKDLDGQRTSLIILMIALLIAQGALISWLAFIDIKPLSNEQ